MTKFLNLRGSGFGIGFYLILMSGALFSECYAYAQSPMDLDDLPVTDMINKESTLPPSTDADPTQNLNQQKDALLKDLQMDPVGDFKSPQFQSYLDSISPFRVQSGNAIRLLDTGDQHWKKILEIIQRADRFVNLSYLEFKTDEIGYAITTALITKRLQITKYLTNKNLTTLNSYFNADDLDLSVVDSDEKIVARFLETPGTGLEIQDRPISPIRPRNETVNHGMDQLLNWYVSERLKNDEAAASRISEILADPSLFQIQLNQYLANSVEIRVRLDFFNVALKDLPGNEPSALLSSMHKVGIQSQYAHNAFIWISNHFKITSSDHESVISGGNIVDKVMEVDPTHITFRDTAFSIQGPLVSDINQFFLKRYYNQSVYQTRLANEGAAFFAYTPDLNHPVDPLSTSVDGRLSDTIPFESINSLRTFTAALRATKYSFVTEMGFFTDPMIGILLARKAKTLNIRDYKNKNGENWKQSTCDPEKLALRPHVVVIVPRYPDQMFTQVSLIGMLPGLMKAGVDVCNWDGGIANQVLAETGVSGRTYTGRAMLHSKLWIADDSFAYLGSANLTHRSLWTDYELGMLTTDATFIGSMKNKIINLDLKSSVPSRYHWYERIVDVATWFINWGLWLD